MNQYIKSIIEGFDFGNVKGNASLNITKVLQKEISIKNILLKDYNMPEYLFTNENIDDEYEGKDKLGYDELILSYNFESEMEADDGSMVDVGEGSEFYDNICTAFKTNGFKTIEINNTFASCLYYYIMSYPLQTDKDIMDFTVDDYLKYCKHYSDDEIEKMYQDELEHSGDSKVRRINAEFKYAENKLRNIKDFYKNQFSLLNDKEKEALVRYCRTIRYLSVSNFTLRISPDDLLVIRFDLEDPSLHFGTETWSTDIHMEVNYLDSILKIKDDWLDKGAYERTYKGKYDGWHLEYGTYFYYDNSWQQMHGDRINDFDEYKQKKQGLQEGFDFGNVKGSAPSNITKVLLKELSLKNILLKQYHMPEELFTNECMDEEYESKDKQGYNTLHISYNFESDMEFSDDSVTDVGDGSDFYDNICGAFNENKFKTVKVNGLHGVAYYIMSYPLLTDKDIMDFTVDDYLKYCKHYSDDEIEKMYQDELEHSTTDTRTMNCAFEWAWAEELRYIKYFYRDYFSKLNEKERESIVRYCRTIRYLGCNEFTIKISPDDLLFIRFDLENPEQGYDSDVWSTNIFMDVYYMESVLKINHDWASTSDYERTYEGKYNGWQNYTNYYYYNNLWEEMHGGRINDYDEYRESKKSGVITEAIKRHKLRNSKYLFESQQSNLGGFIQELNKVFDVKLHNYDPRENGRCLTYITVDTFDENNNDFKELMDKFQVFISSTDEFDAPDGTIQVCFESKYPEDVTKYVYKNSKVLYHLTRPNYIKQISEEGLKPVAATEFRKSWYPARIYLLTDRCISKDIKTYARQLGTSYIVICDIEKMGDNYDFYKDPQSLENFSVFTDKPIPKECIQIMSLKDFYKL